MSCVSNVVFELLMAVADDQENATTNWLTQEHYCANEGCIAVFVERGRLVEEDEEAGVSLGDR